MRRPRKKDISIFGASFLDVLANTIGGLAFLLVMAALMMGQFKAPTVLTEILPEAHAGEDYQAWLSAREGAGKYDWKITDGELPKGLELNDFGAISGLCQAEKGEFAFTVECKASGGKQQKQFYLNVVGGTPPPTRPLRILTKEKLPPAIQAGDYPLSLAATGGAGVYHWRVDSGGIPGLQLLENGHFQGKPQEVGKFFITVTVAMNSEFTGQKKARRFTVDVKKIWPEPKPLRILTRKLPDAMVDSEYPLQLAAEGGVPPYKWSPIPDAQVKWMKTANNGYCSGVPSESGDFQLRWKVTDSQGTATVTSDLMRLKVVDPPTPVEPLVIKTALMQKGRAGDDYEIALSAEGGKLPYKWACSGLPQGMNISGGKIRGSAKESGTSKIMVKLADASGLSAQKEFALEMEPALLKLKVLTDIAPVSRVGSEYNLVLAAEGGLMPYSWQVIDGSLPAGMRLEGNRIVGAPETPGKYKFRLKVVDAQVKAASAQQELEVQVLTEEERDELKIITESLPAAMQGEEYNLTLSAIGGKPPYEWEVTGLPAGAVLENDTIKGIPGEEGEYPLEIKVKDPSSATSQETEKQLSLTVKHVIPFLWLLIAGIVAILLLLLCIYLLVKNKKAKRETERMKTENDEAEKKKGEIEKLIDQLSQQSPPLEIVTKELPNARASCEYQVQLACQGGVMPYRWEVIDGQLPPGMSLSEDGILSGTPFVGVNVDSTRDVAFTVRVTDQTGNSAEQDL